MTDTDDGRTCFPVPADGFTTSIDWKGPGEAPEPGERVFQQREGSTWDRRTWPCNRDHPEQTGPLPMVAVTPSPHSNGRTVHLYLPGYAPGGQRGKSRSVKTSAMCGAIGINTTFWNIVTAKDEPTGREHWPVSAAVHELAHRGYLRWCAYCVGRAAEHLDVLNDVVRLVVERDLTDEASR